jgi:hypothetical protein
VDSVEWNFIITFPRRKAITQTPNKAWLDNPLSAGSWGGGVLVILGFVAVFSPAGASTSALDAEGAGLRAIKSFPSLMFYSADAITSAFARIRHEVQFDSLLPDRATHAMVQRWLVCGDGPIGDVMFLR